MDALDLTDQFLEEYHQLQERLEECESLQSDQKGLGDELKAARQRSIDLGEELASEQKKNRELEDQLENAQATRRAAEVERDDARSKSERLQQKLEDAEKQIEQLKEAGSTASGALPENPPPPAPEDNFSASHEAHLQIEELSSELNQLRMELKDAELKLESAQSRNRGQHKEILRLKLELNKRR